MLQSHITRHIYIMHFFLSSTCMQVTKLQAKKKFKCYTPKSRQSMSIIKMKALLVGRKSELIEKYMIEMPIAMLV